MIIMIDVSKLCTTISSQSIYNCNCIYLATDLARVWMPVIPPFLHTALSLIEEHPCTPWWKDKAGYRLGEPGAGS